MGEDGRMRSFDRHTRAVAIAVVVATALTVAMVIRPRLQQLQTATTGAGGVSLMIVGVLLTGAALVPLAALSRSQRWKPLAASALALVLVAALVLSFDERDGSDGLFMFPLLLGSVLILGLAAVVTLRLRRPAA